MQPFSYQYQGETVECLYALSLEKGDVRYNVKLRDSWFTIVPLTFPRHPVTNGILWHQANKEGEPILPHDLVQAMGEGMEDLL